MGNSEADISANHHMTPSAQDQHLSSSPAAVYPDWASFQAYYNPAGTARIASTGFFHSPMASPSQGYPYIWAPQMIPQYGTPPQYMAMYHPGGLYPHPSMPAVASVGEEEMDGRLSKGKEKISLKRPKGSLGSLNLLTGKGNEIGKTSGASANGDFSQSGESGSEGSSEATNMISQNGSQQKRGGEGGSGDEVRNGSVAGSASNGVTQLLPTPAVLTHSTPLPAIPLGESAGPTMTLNIGMDYWGRPETSPIHKSRGKLPATSSASAVLPSSLAGSRDSVPSDSWAQDEGELKRRKRMQSNRESARRSRVKKQAEWEELSERVVNLKEENDLLREELRRVQTDCDRLAFENSFLNDKLRKPEV